MNELLARETGPLYTMVNEKRAAYYEQFGFRRVDVSQHPADFRKEYRIGRIVTTLMSAFRKERVKIVPLRRG
jgi:N-acetylglutamate synthase-like GNAT family acetyltransferase